MEEESFMKLSYEEPKINIRKYDFPSNVLFTSPSGGEDLGDGPDYGELPKNVFSN